MTTEIIGYVASALVLLTFMTNDMRLLRVIAILSNMAFITYGALEGLPPVLGLHALLLPLNIAQLLALHMSGRADQNTACFEFAGASLGERMRNGESPSPRDEAIRWLHRQASATARTRRPRHGEQHDARTPKLS